MRARIIFSQKIQTAIYKTYVVSLLVFVVWAAQFIYPLIYWEFQYYGTETKFKLDKNEPELEKMKKLREHVDGDSQLKEVDLGDVVIREHYEPGHFHHVGYNLAVPVYNGCDYCHTITPHKKDEEARSFRNLHGYFMACETCHYLDSLPPKKTKHRWLTVTTKETSKRPLTPSEVPISANSRDSVENEMYDSRIVPLVNLNEELDLVIGRTGEDNARTDLHNADKYTYSQIKGKLLRMHNGLTKDPLECDDCHTKNSPALSYKELGYSAEGSRKLMDTEIASLISKYDKFHFPNLFIRKDDRSRKNTRAQ